ncbi:MAG: hypothetical protein B7Y36_17200 [Novosphingobium sp. 28-62-57]|uniref:hypothetical protein n=1 Tax=unclassified Novosphingobium TaxID=2644732 RepID=UPI000BD8B935|nr:MULTISPECIES: hypothetical protein [unclassified Novosphingobium]OYW47670.1 MAG: hypothetical protein B7Z36_02625 [Novosphingobium sp. 12-63-9]OYZ08414.1 MAG: hypothetical protein B7Y36_17200 [Novosphingobium sp. 28-62-57]OZA35114.1 MAG: hypothetical protein B7X92_09830 [Novosphingobium sp. 17-62-9]HQS69309.1 hypothetical protein [Novosphingobium sp.]
MNAKHIVAALAGLSLAALPVVAGAHGSTKPVHGGIVVMSGETVIEMVRAPKGVEIYLTEEDEPLAASGFAGKLIVTAGGAKQETALVPQAGNKLTAPGLKIPAGTKVVVSLTAKGSGAKTLASFAVK